MIDKIYFKISYAYFLFYYIQSYPRYPTDYKSESLRMDECLLLYHSKITKRISIKLYSNTVYISNYHIGYLYPGTRTKSRAKASIIKTLAKLTMCWSYWNYVIGPQRVFVESGECVANWQWLTDRVWIIIYVTLR